MHLAQYANNTYMQKNQKNQLKKTVLVGNHCMFLPPTVNICHSHNQCNWYCCNCRKMLIVFLQGIAGRAHPNAYRMFQAHTRSLATLGYLRMYTHSSVHLRILMIKVESSWNLDTTRKNTWVPLQPQRIYLSVEHMCDQSTVHLNKYTSNHHFPHKTWLCINLYNE